MNFFIKAKHVKMRKLTGFFSRKHLSLPPFLACTILVVLALLSAMRWNTRTNASVSYVGNGLNAVYYNNQDFTGTTYSRIDPTVNFDWGLNSPVPAISPKSYTVRWTGYVVPKYSETYTFYTTTDDGVRLWVNNQLLIDKWHDQGPTEWSGTITLTAGQMYAIQMDYYQNGGGAVAKLSWNSPSQAKQIIPGNQLYSCATQSQCAGNVFSLDTTQTTGAVNQLTWGVGAPGNELQWAGNAQLKQKISDAKIKLVRVAPVGYANTVLGHSMCTSPTSCDYTQMDAALQTIFDSGAEPLFIVEGYPGGINRYDWQNYATFMQQVVTRYNVNLQLGRKIRYFEMWNEPLDEPSGSIPTQDLYGSFVRTVGGAMKGVDQTIKLVAPAFSYPNFASDGWLNYTAQNTNDLVDVLSWHDYGDNSVDNQTRLLATRPKYYDNMLTVGQSNDFVSTTSGKRYAASITEYNMAGQALSNESTQEFHNNYNAVYAASSIINAIKAQVDHFTFFNLAQAGTNLLGILDPTSNYAPYTPYYTFHMFGNRFGANLISETGGNDLLEYTASKSQDGQTISVIATNKDIVNAMPIEIHVNTISSGSYTAYVLDATTLPTSGTTGSFAGGTLRFTLPPLSVVAFEITQQTPTNTPTRTPTNTPTPTPDTTAPTVTITSPANNSTVQKGSFVTVTATATDNLRVTKVEFWVGTTLVCTDTTSPYSCNWTVPVKPNTQYTLQAKAYDQAGNIGTHSITVTSSR